MFAADGASTRVLICLPCDGQWRTQFADKAAWPLADATTDIAFVRELCGRYPCFKSLGG